MLSNVTDTRTELLISKGIPYLAKRGVGVGRYYPSEPMRDPALKKKAINYGRGNLDLRLKTLSRN